MKNQAQIQHELGPHPVLIGRKWPMELHTWTSAKFEEFLAKHRYPAHTWDDLQKSRMASVVKAIAEGKSVPEEVIAEFPEAEAHALEQQATDRAWIWLNTRVANMQSELRRSLGFYGPEEVYRRNVLAIIKDALHSVSKDFSLRVRSGVVVVNWMGTQYAMMIDEGRPSTQGYFGSIAGRERKVVLCLRNDSAIGFVLHSLSWGFVDRCLRELRSSGQLTYEQIWNWTGFGWSDVAPRVHRIQSGAEHAAV